MTSYATVRPATSRPTSTIIYTSPINSRKSKRSNGLKTIYNQAGKSFVLKDFGTTAALLHDALPYTHSTSQSDWINRLEEPGETMVEEDADLMRKLEILRITFFATVRSASEPLLSSPESIADFLDLPVPELIAALWSTSIQQPHEPNNIDIFPSPAAASLHPSIATALVLAALKLGSPRSARAIAESFFCSTSSQFDEILFHTAASPSVDFTTMFRLDEMTMSHSIVQGGAGVKERLDPKVTIVGNWIRLMDLLTLHVLPQLGEWEAAGDFLRLQSVDTGGWIPEERVEMALAQLVVLQQQEVASIHAKRQRMKDLEAIKVEKAKEKERDRRRVEKGKGRATSAVSTSPPTSTTALPRVGPPLPSSKSKSDLVVVVPKPTLSFSSLRSTFSAYLRRPSSSPVSSAIATTPPFYTLLTSFSPSSLLSYIKHHATIDPIRFVSLLFTVFALSSWLRKRLLLGGGGGGVTMRRGTNARTTDGTSLKSMVGFMAGRVGETIKMATKVTSL